MPQDLLQAPYRANVAQGICDPVQVRGVVPVGETVAFLGETDSLPYRLVGDVLTAVEDHHNIERGMAAHANRQMTPVGIPDMEVVAIDVGSGLLAAQVDPVVAVPPHVPDRGLGTADQDTDDAGAPRIGGQVLFADLV